nr:hypothetical protein [Burkholderiales bacterium]
MKWIFFLILLINLGLYAWGQFGRQNAPNPLARQEIRAEKIRIVGPASPSPASSPVPASTPAPGLSCYRWGIFSGNDIEAARNAVTAVAPAAQIYE